MWRKIVWAIVGFGALLPASVLIHVLDYSLRAIGWVEDKGQDWIEHAVQRGNQWAYREEYDEESEG